jgi:hypothetical protein
VRFVAVVTPATETPTGTVQFKADGVNLGPSVAVVGGQAISADVTTLSLGSHAIQADYSGSRSISLSVGSLTQTVNPPTTRTELMGPSFALYGAASAFSARITQRVYRSSPHPTGTVQFKVDGVNLGAPVALAGAGGDAAKSVDTPLALPAGTHSVIAVYEGDAYFKGSSSTPKSLSVRKAVTQTQASAYPIFTFGQQNVFCSGNVHSAWLGSDRSGFLQFKVDDVDLGPPVATGNGLGRVGLSTIPVGSHSCSVEFSGNSNVYGSKSGGSTFTVRPAN